MIMRVGPMMMSLFVLVMTVGCSSTKQPVPEESAVSEEPAVSEETAVSGERTAPEKRRSMRSQPDDSAQLKVGQMAPTFKLKSLDGKEEMDLAAFKGKRPVVLFFGSYT
ncbi:hypothetical protein ACFL6S_25985 [Candidatus Poribacteria bacterium]